MSLLQLLVQCVRVLKGLCWSLCCPVTAHMWSPPAFVRPPWVQPFIAFASSPIDNSQTVAKLSGGGQHCYLGRSVCVCIVCADLNTLEHMLSHSGDHGSVGGGWRRGKAGQYSSQISGVGSRVVTLPGGQACAHVDQPTYREHPALYRSPLFSILEL